MHPRHETEPTSFALIAPPSNFSLKRSVVLGAELCLTVRVPSAYLTNYNDSNVTKFRTLIDALNAAPGDRLFVTAWIDEDEREDVTFAEFRRRSRVQAAILHDHHVAEGDRVVLIMPQGIATMTTFVGAMLLGATPAILAYPNFKVDSDKYRDGLSGVTANLAAKVMVIDEEFPEDLLGHVHLSNGTELIRAGHSELSTDEVRSPNVTIQPNSLAFIQHSAGTTGLQKGVALTHAAVLTQLEHLVEVLRIDGATDRVYSWLPLYHDMGLIACFMLPLVSHTHVVMQSPLDWVMHPESMLQIIEDYKCSLAWLPNFAFQFVPRRTRQRTLPQLDLSSMRALINCSEPVRSSSMGEFHEAFAHMGFKPGALQSCYAMAENVFAVTQSDITQTSGPTRVLADALQFRSNQRVVQVEEASAGAIAFTSSGRILPNHQIRIVSGSNQHLPDGAVGEILVKSDCLFEGYYNRSDLTSLVLADGWYRSGDLGFYLNGELYVVGRKKDLLIVGGENLYPQDIEEIVARHPAIHDGRAVAIGLYNPDSGTEEIVVIAEVETEQLLAEATEIEQQIRNNVVAGLGVAVRNIFLKPPKWIVKSTAGKAARSSTRDKFLREHPEINVEPQETLV
jgi:fatty-acyl-CoA synthase